MNRATIAVCILLGAFPIARAAPPLEAYGHLPGVETVKLSPSGERYATMAVVGDKHRLIVATVAGKVLQAVDIGDEKLLRLDWAGEDHVLVWLRATFKMPVYVSQDSEFATVADLVVSSGKILKIFDRSINPAIADIVFGSAGYAQADGHSYGYFRGLTYRVGSSGQIVTDGNHPYTDLYRVDLDSGKATQVAQGSVRNSHWIVARDGALIAHSEYEPREGHWMLFAGKDRAKLLMETTSLLETPYVEGPGRAAGTVLVIDRTDKRDVILEVSLADGHREELDYEGTIDDHLRDPETDLLLGFLMEGPPFAKLFDALSQARLMAVRKAYPGLRIEVQSISRKLDRVVVKTDGGDDSGTFWLVDIAAGKADPLGYAYPAIRAADVGPTRMFSYKASDGLALDGVLTLPPGKKASGLPVVVMPHGGPIDIDDRVGFDWWAQAYAAAGYAVFQPNYRGSAGYGRAFRDAGFGEWGGRMLTDISEGLAALAAQGVVDAKRACIVGASYGGYAALAGVTLQHGLYRCAVSVAGPADMPQFFHWEVERYGSVGGETRYWRRVTGADKEGDAAMGRISPARFAAQADAPILLVHGEDDTVVPMAQSEIMAAALKSAGKPFEFTRMPGEDHGLSRGVTRTTMLKAAVEFVTRHNPP